MAEGTRMPVAEPVMSAAVMPSVVSTTVMPTPAVMAAPAVATPTRSVQRYSH